METEISEILLLENGFEPESFVLDYKDSNKKEINIKGFIKDFDIKHGIVNRFILIALINNHFYLSFEVKNESPYMPHIQIVTIEELNKHIDLFTLQHHKLMNSKS